MRMLAGNSVFIEGVILMFIFTFVQCCVKQIPRNFGVPVYKPIEDSSEEQGGSYEDNDTKEQHLVRQSRALVGYSVRNEEHQKVKDKLPNKEISQNFLKEKSLQQHHLQILKKLTQAVTYIKNKLSSYGNFSTIVWNIAKDVLPAKFLQHIKTSSYNNQPNHNGSVQMKQQEWNKTMREVETTQMNLNNPCTTTTGVISFVGLAVGLSVGVIVALGLICLLKKSWSHDLQYKSQQVKEIIEDKILITDNDTAKEAEAFMPC